MRAKFQKVPVNPERSFHLLERKLPRFTAPWHFHPEVELTLILAGRGRRFVGDSIEPFAEGDFVLIGPNLPHFWQSEEPRGDARAHCMVVQFSPEVLGDRFLALPEFAAVRRLLTASSRGLQFTGQAAVEASLRLRALGTISGMSALLEFFAILDILAHAGAKRRLTSLAYEPSLDVQAERRLARVYKFLTARFREPLPLSQIARVAAMTPPGFSRYFRRVTGRNVSAFLNDLRVDHSARLLAESDRTVADIAGAVGYETLSNFNRRFRERMGMPPREYRQTLGLET